MVERHGGARALAQVDPRWDAARTERALTALHRRRARRRATTVLAGLALLLSVSGLGVWQADLGAPSPVAASDAPAPASPDRVVRLADGSRVVPEEGAQVVVEHVTDGLIVVRVDRGAADLEVVPGLLRRFEVRVGEITVSVLGTAFRVERLDEVRARVSVEHGHVDVAWAAGHADLFAGDEGIFPAVEPTLAREESPDVVAVAPIAEEARPASHGERESGETPGWRELARGSDYDAAYLALGTPSERARAVTDTVEDLLLAADVARLSGHPVDALPWLRTVERDHASDPRAVLASFTVGRILLELGRPSEAAAQLEAALAMEPNGSLAEDALARAALAWSAAGSGERAAVLADRYLASHPTGRWAARVRAIATDSASPD